MKYLLDSNACVDHLRRGPNSYLTTRLTIEPLNNLCLCSVVRGELIQGAFRSRDPAATAQAVRDFCDRSISLPFDDRASDLCGEFRAHLAKLGSPIGPNDLMIAMAHRLTVVTDNVSEFRRVPGLVVEDWSLS